MTGQKLGGAGMRLDPSCSTSCSQRSSVKKAPSAATLTMKSVCRGSSVSMVTSSGRFSTAMTPAMASWSSLRARNSLVRCTCAVRKRALRMCVMRLMGCALEIGTCGCGADRPPCTPARWKDLTTAASSGSSAAFHGCAISKSRQPPTISGMVWTTVPPGHWKMRWPSQAEVALWKPVLTSVSLLRRQKRVSSMGTTTTRAAT